MTFPRIILPDLPPNTIVPDSDALFTPYLNRLYEDIAFAVNNRDYNEFVIPITAVATNIPNLPNFGAFLVCISGASETYPLPLPNTQTGLPTITASLCKASSGIAGVVNVIGSQAGNVGTWIGIVLTITATATNFQVAHNLAATTGNFNIRIVGTQ